MNKACLSGLDDGWIDRESLPCAIHRQVVGPFQALQVAAARQGFSLAIASGYRGFQRQLEIWNAKACGQRPVLDSAGCPLNISDLEPWPLVQAILRWSALPGASRHHWGTDLDVYDAKAVDVGYAVQLTAAEVTGNGPFVALHDWLDRQIDDGCAEGFFRPYQQDCGGIAPERWHLSYAPLAYGFQQALDLDTLVGVIEQQPVLLRPTILEHIEEIYQRFVVVPQDLYPGRW